MDYKDLIAGNISGITGLEKEKVFELIEIPPRLDMGDFAFPCFTLAKTLHKAPPLIAQEIAANAAVDAGAEKSSRQPQSALISISSSTAKCLLKSLLPRSARQAIPSVPKAGERQERHR